MLGRAGLFALLFGASSALAAQTPGELPSRPPAPSVRPEPTAVADPEGDPGTSRTVLLIALGVGVTALGYGLGKVLRRRRR